jgi:hypothetical protein
MADGHVPLAQTFHHFGREYVRNQSQIFVIVKQSVVVYGDPCSLLSTVLKRIQAVIDKGRHIHGLGSEYPENTAFFVKMF